MVNEGTTNEQGSYTIEDVAKGSLTITVNKEGFVESSQTINVTSDTTVNFTLEEESVEEEPVTRTVDFTVQDNSEQGISGARITLTDTTTNEETTNSNGGTGSSGGSSITGVAYGEYTVTVTKDTYTDATFTLTVGEELSATGDGATVTNDRVVVTLAQ